MLNKVQLMGALGRDPEIKSFQNGDPMALLNLATTERWKDRNTGERRERTEWHRVVIYNPGLVEVAKRYLRKGSRVYLEGQLQTRKWQNQRGDDVYTTEVVLKVFGGELRLLDKREDGGGVRDGGSVDPPISGSSAPPPDLDDDVPF
jgi:single-strand DNA-binding protein